uniref:Uncharacterized protein n=1 Tax=Mycena chlorophos TaxID=658473 RepID=A0ABQ0LMU2_MYCCL|nr:predicted protein [Mycena chlorophos]
MSTSTSSPHLSTQPIELVASNSFEILTVESCSLQNLHLQATELESNTERVPDTRDGSAFLSIIGNHLHNLANSTTTLFTDIGATVQSACSTFLAPSPNIKTAVSSPLPNPTNAFKSLKARQRQDKKRQILAIKDKDPNDPRVLRALQKKQAARARTQKNRKEKHFKAPQSFVRHPHRAPIVAARVGLSGLHVDRSGYCGFNHTWGPNPVSKLPSKFTLKLMQELNFTCIHFDGQNSKLLCDKTGKSFGLLLGHNNNKTYLEACTQAFYKILAAGSSGSEPSGASWDIHRGVKSVNDGWFYGKGMQNMAWMNKSVAGIAPQLRKDSDISRVCTFATAALQLWFPKLYEQSMDRLTKIDEHFGDHNRTFARSAFACVAFNFGPQVATILHRDWTDEAGKLCAVWNGGDFDPKLGGHLVLWELGLYIEFPPGCWILFPSALITHANIPIQPHEKRVSIVQYTPGGVCRFVDNGFRTEKQFRLEDPEGYEAMLQRKATRWEESKELFCTYEELREIYKADDHPLEGELTDMEFSD